jgi:hypothetical protein
VCGTRDSSTPGSSAAYAAPLSTGGGGGEKEGRQGEAGRSGQARRRAARRPWGWPASGAWEQTGGGQPVALGSKLESECPAQQRGPSLAGSLHQPARQPQAGTEPRAPGAEG